MRAGPAFLQFDSSKAGLSMDLPVFVYSHTKTGFKFFHYREDIVSFLCAWRSQARSVLQDLGLNILLYEKQTRLINSIY